MGTQFWWFYDVIAGAAVLVCVFLSGRKGVVKGMVTALGLILAAAVALGVSGAVADSLSGKTIANSNAKKIARVIESSTFTDKFASYLENMGYSLKIDKGKLEKVLDSNAQYDEAVAKYVNNVNARKVEENNDVLLEKIHEGYAVVIGGIVEEALSKFTAESAAAAIRNDSSGMQELIPLLREQENMHPAAKFIAEKYTCGAYRVLIRLIAFIASYIIFGLLIVCSINAFLGKREVSAIGVSSHIAGGFAGIISAVTIVFAIAVCVRLWAVMGSDEMLFFNNDVVEKSYVFKYFYDYAMNL